MPHQCVRCGTFYEDGAKELLEGCECGGKFFFFIKKKTIEEAKQITADLTQDDRQKIEKDVLDIVGIEEDDTTPVVLDLENIRVKKPGQYELNLIDLFKGEPLVYRLEDGKYIIDLPKSFKKRS